MTKDDDHRSGKATEHSDGGRAERDAAAKAVLDNMARLRALRLAREATEPKTTTSAKVKRVKSASGRPSGKKDAAKPRALSDWLAEQQSGGRRT